MAQKIILEDRGQNLTSFTLTDAAEIADADYCPQHFNGMRVSNAPLKPGDRVEFAAGGYLAYPVKSATRAILPEAGR